MKAHSNTMHHDTAPATVRVRVIPAETSSDAGDRSPAIEEFTVPRREHAVDPLWMIVVAMGFMFALLAVLVAFS